MSDYLIQTVGGASEALTSASLACLEHKEQSYAENYSVRQAWRALNESSRVRPSVEQYLAAIPRDGTANRRAQRVTASAEQCFFHLGQVLDRLAAAIIIVGGFGNKNVIQSDWTTIENLQSASRREIRRPKNQFEYPLILDADTTGGEVQRRLLAAADPASFGPSGWLSWLRDTRNAMTHRPPAKKMNIMIDKGTFTRVFYRHPKWSEVQAYVYSASSASGRRRTEVEFRQQFLMRSSTDILEGLCDSMTLMVVNLVNLMENCWDARRANPQLIMQHAVQWPKPEPKVAESAQFDGYGISLEPKLDTVMLNPSESRRWQAARVDDSRWGDWNE